eukprot:scaffold22199_cov118-Isochrysis_galbana.AAC.1
MIEVGIQPNTISYNAALQVCLAPPTPLPQPSPHPDLSTSSPVMRPCSSKDTPGCLNQTHTTAQ